MRYGNERTGILLQCASKTSRDGISRWLVGSSNTNTLLLDKTNFASAKRAFSPPLSTFTFLSMSSAKNEIVPAWHALASDSNSGVRSTMPVTRCPRRRGFAVPDHSIPHKPDCRKSLHLGSGTVAGYYLSNVDFPQPLGPSKNRRSWRLITAEKSEKRRCWSNCLLKCSRYITSLPLVCAVKKCICIARGSSLGRSTFSMRSNAFCRLSAAMIFRWRFHCRCFAMYASWRRISFVD